MISRVHILLLLGAWLAVSVAHAADKTGDFDGLTRWMDEFLARYNVSGGALAVTQNDGKFDIDSTVSGGGINGQAGAMRHGLARALTAVNAEWRPAVKAAGLLTRDSRKRERKKPGQPGARKRYQFSKR